MPRHFANSTAIAALIGLGLAATATAEITLSADQAREVAPARAEAMNLLDRVFQQELAAGVNAGALRCLDDSARPCADDMPLITPAGVAVELVEGGGMILAPAEMQPYRMTKDGTPVTRGNDLARLADENLERVANAAAMLARQPVEPLAVIEDPNKPAEAGTDPLTAVIEAARNEAQKETVETAPKPDAPTEAEVEAAAMAEAMAKATAPVKTEADVEAEAMAKAMADAETRASDAKQDELARQLAAAQSEAGTKAAPAAALMDSHAGQEPRITEAEGDRFNTERDASMPRLNKVLQREVQTGLTADGLTCIDGSARPCADGVALVSPGGVTAEVTESGRIVIGPMAKQQFIVGEDGKLRARGSNTAAAREAAEAVAPTVEAFTQPASGEIIRETVADTRSSAQDFETSLTEALKAATAQPAAQSSESDSGGSDLAKVALAGLGALAVGQVLSGQREVALNTGDRVIVTRADGSQQVLKDDNALLRQAGNEVQTENYSDGSSRSVVTRPDGSQIITIRGADLTVLRRIHVAADGSETVLIDDSVEVPPVQIAELPPAPKPEATPTTEAQLRAALAREAAVNRRFTLNQIRTIPEVRNLVAPVDINAITFDTGSAAINPDQARQLAALGTAIEDAVAANPREIFLIEGHTDAVGSATYNLALSDRRAESVALALSEYFRVPPENMVVQGYGEEYLKIPVLTDERQNRRASVRRITDLLASAQ